MTTRRANESGIRIRTADAGDDNFILSLLPRFAEFELPKWRRKSDIVAGIRRDRERALADPPAGEAVLVAEDAEGVRVGFLRLQRVKDFFNGKPNCHISDLAVAPGRDGRGVGRALLAYAEQWAKSQRCALLTLSVFPGNARARALYERAGFATELLRLAKPLK